MVAVPYRAELRTSALRGVAAIALIVVGALLAAVFYSRRGERLGRRLERVQPLDPEADRVAPGPIRWGTMPLQALGLGLIIGGLCLLIEIDLETVGLGLAIGLGGVAGADLLKVLTVARYERAHRGTVYRLADDELALAT